MPPVDRRYSPDLVRALPGDDLPPGADDGYRPVNEPCMVVMGDGGWRPVTLVAWRRDRLGRWVASLEWHAQGGTWQESYVHDPRKMSRG